VKIISPTGIHFDELITFNKSVKIDVSGLVSGVYFVYVSNADSLPVVQKLIISN
jgi:hypothetical protein